ncbi:hypothetical protein [Motilimonas pumila]|uniref:Uncharacterized protein n=1 Tax=Motilimonas pumila TaxID=2303987 RepID=A0A418YCV9_9GAMM|nr:hypothetical protein [Motilimonas pumila]RJG42334.1 hypothetical protein D1Z90_13730 [Motilimonas pumila]
MLGLTLVAVMPALAMWLSALMLNSRGSFPVYYIVCLAGLITMQLPSYGFLLAILVICISLKLLTKMPLFPEIGLQLVLNLFVMLAIVQGFNDSMHHLLGFIEHN